MWKNFSVSWIPAFTTSVSIWVAAINVNFIHAFSLGHLGNFAIPNDDYGISFIYYFFCGIFFCSAFYWSNTLWFPIGIHFGSNLLILNFFSIEHIEWIQPLKVDSYIDDTVATRSIQVEWLIRCCLYAVFSVFLVYRNKALYRTLRKYFHEPS